MFVLAIDGGADHKKHVESERGTGWALIEAFEDAAPRLAAFGQVVGGPTPFLNAATATTGDLADAIAQADMFVVEGFRLLNPRAKIDPLEIVGMVRMYAALTGRPCAVQPPAHRTLVDHDDLKRIGMWPGGKGHADTAQAIRHGLSWLIRQRNRPTAALVAPPPVSADSDEGAVQ